MRPTWMMALAAVALGASLAGCQHDPWAEQAPRSPYERYATLRGQSAPDKELDPSGIERPALRDRLRPLEQP